MGATLSYSTLSLPWTSAWLGIAFSWGVLHQRPFTPQTPYTRWPYTTALLHRKPFTPETFYTRRILHQRRFIPQPFYAAKLLSTRESLLHQNQSTQTLHTRNFLHQRRFPSDPGLTLNANSLICVLQSRLVLQVRLPIGIVKFQRFPLLSSPLLSSLLLSSSPLLWGWVVRYYLWKIIIDGTRSLKEPYCCAFRKNKRTKMGNAASGKQQQSTGSFEVTKNSKVSRLYWHSSITPSFGHYKDLFCNISKVVAGITWGFGSSSQADRWAWWMKCSIKNSSKSTGSSTLRKNLSRSH